MATRVHGRGGGPGHRGRLAGGRGLAVALGEAMAEELREELSDEDWLALAKTMRVSRCSECKERTISSNDAPKPSTCGRLLCLVAARKEEWI